MDSHFIVSDNNSNYRDLAKLFIDRNLYEIDLVGKNTSANSRKKQMDSANNAFANGLTYLYMEDKKTKKMYRGEMLTPFKLNTEHPFYLTSDVISRAKTESDITSDPYYTSYVAWNPNSLSSNDVEQVKNDIKNTSGFKALTLFKFNSTM
jgi:hypothetical protein